MARTIQEIYNDLVAEKDTQTELNALNPDGDNFDDLLSDLNSPSKVAIWRLWAYVTAVSIWTLEKLFDQHKIDIDDAILASAYGNDLWWLDRMREFQFGDDLIVTEINGEKVLTYAVIDPVKQIIDFVAISDTTDGASVIKVAKDDGGGLPAPLTTAELISATEFVDRIQPAGAKLTVISQASDLAKYEIDVYYNGLFDVSVVQTNVENAINTYHQNLEFDGSVVVSALVDAIQSVDGVEDVFTTNIEIKPSGGSFVTVDRIYTTSSGSVKVDPTFPLSSTINYLPF